MIPNPYNNLDENNDDIQSIFSEITPDEIKKLTSFIHSNFQNENERIEEVDNSHLFKNSFEGREQRENNCCNLDKEIILEKSQKSGIVLEIDNSVRIKRKSDDCFYSNHNSLTKAFFPEEQYNISILENNISKSNESYRKKLFKINFRIHDDTRKVNNLLNKKRQREKKTYKGTKYLDNFNIKNKLLTHFLNDYVLNDNNDIIQHAGCGLYFERFPRKLIIHFIAEKRTKELFKMTLGEIYTNEKLYDEKNIKSHFVYNSEVIKQLFSVDEYKYVKEQSGIKEKLEMKISDLFQKYLNSDEFKDDIDGLKIESGEDYVEKYLKNAKNLCIYHYFWSYFLSKY